MDQQHCEAWAITPNARSCILDARREMLNALGAGWQASHDGGSDDFFAAVVRSAGGHAKTARKVTVLQLRNERAAYIPHIFACEGEKYERYINAVEQGAPADGLIAKVLSDALRWPFMIHRVIEHDVVTRKVTPNLCPAGAGGDALMAEEREPSTWVLRAVGGFTCVGCSHQQSPTTTNLRSMLANPRSLPCRRSYFRRLSQRSAIRKQRAKHGLHTHAAGRHTGT